MAYDPAMGGGLLAPQQAPQLPSAALAPPAGMAPGMMPPQQAAPAPVAQPYAGKLHDVTICKVRKIARCVIENVPPEECGVSRRARSPRNADLDYFYHDTTERVSDLIAQGFDEDELMEAPAAQGDSTTEALSRDTVGEAAATSTNDLNDATRQIDTTEHYVRMDYEKNGRPSLYKVKTLRDTNTIMTFKGKPAIEQIDCIPFATITPILMPHRYYGRSIADVVIDIQRIKTALKRQLLNSVYFSNNQRMEVGEEGATKDTIDDILTNRVGGVIRTKRVGSIAPVQNAPISADVLGVIEYTDAEREFRTGVTRQGQGIDGKALQKSQNVGQEAVMQLLSMAQARIRFIARVFAETGIKDLMWLIHTTLRRNDRGTLAFKLRGKWVKVQPSNWTERDELTADVGIGTGGREQQLMFLMQILGLQEKAIGSPSLKVTDPQHIYNTLKRFTEMGGQKNVDDFWTDPSTRANEPVPPDPETMKMQAQAALEKDRSQHDQQLELAKLGKESEREQAQANASIAQDNAKTENAIKLANQKAALDRNVTIVHAVAQTMVALKNEDGSPKVSPQEIVNLLSSIGGLPDSRPDELSRKIDMLLAAATAETELVYDGMGRPVRSRKVIPQPGA